MEDKETNVINDVETENESTKQDDTTERGTGSEISDCLFDIVMFVIYGFVLKFAWNDLMPNFELAEITYTQALSLALLIETVFYFVGYGFKRGLKGRESDED